MLLGALFAVAAALTVSFLCSLLEACVLSLSSAEVAALGEHRPRVGRIWSAFKRDVEHPLAAILIVNTCAHTIGASLAAARFEHLYGEEGVVVSSVALSYAMIQWSEVLPKTLGSRRRRAVAVMFAVPLQVAVLVLRPLTWLIRVVNRPFEGRGGGEPTSVEEIRALAHEARTARVIGAHEDGIIGRAAALGRVHANDLMVHREDISALSTDMSMEQALVHAHLDAHTRFPLCEAGDLDRVVGYVNLKELVAALHTNPSAPTLRGIARPIREVAPSADGSSVLRAFVEEHLHLALVRDASGRTLGLLTMEDVIEELVGDLEDEFDLLPRRIQELEGLLLIGGGADAAETLARLAASTGTSLAVGGSGSREALRPGDRTIAAWLEGHVGVRPRPGDAVVVDGVRFVVRRVRRGRVFEVAAAKEPSRVDDSPHVLDKNPSSGTSDETR